MGPISALALGPMQASCILPTYMGGEGGSWERNIKVGTGHCKREPLVMGMRWLPMALVGAVWHSMIARVPCMHACRRKCKCTGLTGVIKDRPCWCSVSSLTIGTALLTLPREEVTCAEMYTRAYP